MTDIKSMSPEQRRVLLIASESELDRLRRTVDWKTVARDVVSMLAPFGFYTALWDLVVKNQSVPTDIPWPHISPEEAARRYTFDLGHPQDGTAYILNPVAADHYLLPATANERFVQEKVAAFIEISEAIGAKSLTVKSGTLNRKEANGEFSIQDAAGQAGLGVSFNENHTIERQALVEFGPPTDQPHLPEGMQPWLTHDPILRSFVTTRLRQHRLTKAAVTLRLGESVELVSELTAKLPAMGIKAGGSYKQVLDSTWSFEVDFWPVPAAKDQPG